GQIHFTASNQATQSGVTSKGGVGGSGFANFLLGEPNHFERFVSTSLNAAERQKRWFFYGQDTWRATSKLTLNYGLRCEIYFPESVNAKGNGGVANIVDKGGAGGSRVAGYGPYGLNGGVSNDLHAFVSQTRLPYQ